MHEELFLSGSYFYSSSSCVTILFRRLDVPFIPVYLALCSLNHYRQPLVHGIFHIVGKTFEGSRVARKLPTLHKMTLVAMFADTQQNIVSSEKSLMH
jgi:hypothetical protein